MHTQRNPGHTEFVDKTSEQGALSYAKVNFLSTSEYTLL